MVAKLYSEELAARLPAGMTLPAELVTTLNWLEAQGWAQSFDAEEDRDSFENRFLSIYPLQQMDDPGASFVMFNATDLKHTAYWSTPDPSVDARIFEIARTSGDGGRAALWLAPDDTQWFVHLGHDELGIISDDPVTFLTFLAMGYLEPGAFVDTTLTPLEVALAYYGHDTVEDLDADDDDARPKPPLLFRRFLTETFGVMEIPERASDLGIQPFTEYGEPTTTDAFAKWINDVTPPPTEDELANIEELTKMAEAISRDLMNPSLWQRFKWWITGLRS